MAKLEIPTSLVEYKLYDFLWQMRTKGCDEKTFSLVSKVCHSSLYDLFNDAAKVLIDKLELNEDERLLADQLKLTEHGNPEIRARFSDVMGRYSDREDRKTLRQQASDAYLQVYSLGKSSEFLVRSVQVRIVFDDNFWKTLLKYSYETYPCWLTPIAQFLIKRNIPNARNKYIEPLIEHLEQNGRNEITWTTQFLKFLFEIKHIDAATFNYRTARFYERLGNEGLERQKANPHTFYMDIHQNFGEAFKHIDQVRNQFPEDYSRIRKEYESAKLSFVKMMSMVGVRSQNVIPEGFSEKVVEPFIASIKTDNPFALIVYYGQVPNLTAMKYPEIKEQKPEDDLFGHYVREDNQGNDVGDCDKETYIKENYHSQARSCQLYFLWSILEYREFLGLKYEEYDIIRLIESKRPDFIEEDKMIVWAKGFHLGFNGDYIESAYLLTPMLEAGLRGLACKLKNESLTTLNKERQIQPALEKTLSELQPYINEELFFELNSFLVKGYGVNFRNNLLHGLLSPTDAYRYSPYILYLCLRLYLYPDKFMDLVGESTK